MAGYKTTTKDANTILVTQINTKNITQQSIKQIILKLRETSVGELQKKNLFQKSDLFTKMSESLFTKFAAVLHLTVGQFFPDAENRVKFVILKDGILRIILLTEDRTKIYFRKT
jgi:hypothetical protein